MVTLDNLVVTTALPVIREDLHAGLSGLEWTVNAYTLTFAVLLLTGAALGDRFGRRLHVLDRARHLHARLRRRGARAVDRRARRGACGAGSRRRDRDAADADDPLRGGAGGAPRRLALGAWGGISGLAVAFGPLVGGAVVSGISLALDLLAQRADRPRARSRSRCCGCDEIDGPVRPVDLPGLGLVSAGLFGIVWGLVRGNSRRLGLARDRRRARRRRAARRARSSRGSCARRAPDAADALLPQPHVRAREHRVAADELRDVRLDLPARAVLPDRAGLLAARLRACASSRGRRCR